MSKSGKILLGIATIWPILYMIFFFIFIFTAMTSSPSSVFDDSGSLGSMFAVIFPLHILTSFLMMGLTIYYIVNVFRNERVHQDKKTLWAVVLFLGNVIAMPIYWYLYIWGEEKPAGLPSNNWQSLNSGAVPGWGYDASSGKREREYVPPPEPPNWRDD
jgi:hypothetical protein